MELKILKPGQSGRGILIEEDAGYVSPTQEDNAKIIKESKNFLEPTIEGTKG